MALSIEVGERANLVNSRMATKQMDAGVPNFHVTFLATLELARGPFSGGGSV